MMLSPGTRLGPYEVLSLLGAGGMGEVYRARDSRLGREVAIKVLPAAFSADSDRLRRFEQEARAAGMLNHSNLLVVFDIGEHEGSPYIISELLEGETLRDKLNSMALSQRKAIDYALQIARGLAAAHERGIIHRDLKPENIFITKDSRVKILDFGLAKLMGSLFASGTQAEAPTFQVKTDEGIIMGTVGYMSPEQVRSRAVDQRSDIFSFGAILYEMLTGKRAFRGASPVETLNLILREDPPEVSKSGHNTNPILDRIVRHCLEKNPEERFQSVRDLAFDLETLSGVSDSGPKPSVNARARSKRRLWRLLAVAVLLATVAAASFFFGKRQGAMPPPTYRQLTFRHGTVWSARFAPDGSTVVYSATWNGNPIDIFSTRPENPESRSLGLANADILSISSSGEMAVLLNRRYIAHFVARGTLARMPLVGGTPREVLEDVQEADWSPDGKNLAVVRNVEGRNRLEYPIGNLLYETAGYISHPRVSPDGDKVAFMDHQIQWDNRGWVAVVDLAGNKQTLSNEWSIEEGLAWSQTGEEIWFTASKAGEALALYAVTLSGQERVVARVPMSMMLHDISRDGRVLLKRYNLSTSIFGLPPGETKERDLSWLDYVAVYDLSADGKSFVFQYYGEGSGTNYATYLRKTDGSPAIRLGDGAAMGLSPNGKWVLAILHTPPQLALLPTGAGEVKVLERHEIEEYDQASWFPDGKRVLFTGREPGRGMRCYVQEIDGGGPRPITPEGVTGTLISPDGKYIVSTDVNQKRVLYPLETGNSPRPLTGLNDDDGVIRWGGDGESLYIYQRRQLPLKIYQLNLVTGRRDLWKEVMPSDTAGIRREPQIILTPDGKSYIYYLTRHLTDLYLVEQLK